MPNSVLWPFRRENRARTAALALYREIVKRARNPAFHTNFAVPDTIDGRFDVLTLHAFLVLESLKNSGAVGAAIAKELVTLIFAGFDEALRDLGVGDFGIARRIKAMANAFYGRLEAYSASSDIPPAIVLRNVFRGEERFAAQAEQLSSYIERAKITLRPEQLVAGKADFGELL